MDTVYYEYVKDSRMIFLIRCSDQRGGLYDDCYLTLPFSESLEVEVYFIRDYLKDAVQMVEKLTVKLEGFEAAGRAHGYGVKGH